MREGSHGPRPGHPSTLMLHVCGWLAHTLKDGAFPGVSHPRVVRGVGPRNAGCVSTGRLGPSCAPIWDVPASACRKIVRLARPRMF